MKARLCGVFLMHGKIKREIGDFSSGFTTTVRIIVHCSRSMVKDYQDYIKFVLFLTAKWTPLYLELFLVRLLSVITSLTLPYMIDYVERVFIYID